MYLYCFYFQDANYCKIGKSNNLYQRATSYKARYGWPVASSLTLCGDAQEIEQLEEDLKKELWSWQAKGDDKSRYCRSEFFEVKYYSFMRKRIIEIASQSNSLHLDSWGTFLIEKYSDVQDKVWTLKCYLRKALQLIGAREEHIAIPRTRK